MVGSKEWYQPTQEVAGGALDKFSIAGASGAWYDATATIVGDTVVVSSPSVASPRKVAYACWQNPVGANLYNKVTLDGVANGLPASPFYIDDVTAKYTVTVTAGSGGSISPAGTSTFLLIFPDDALTVAVMANLQNAPVRGLAGEIARGFLEAR